MRTYLQVGAAVGAPGTSGLLRAVLLGGGLPEVHRTVHQRTEGHAVQVQEGLSHGTPGIYFIFFKRHHCCLQPLRACREGLTGRAATWLLGLVHERSREAQPATLCCRCVLGDSTAS